MRHSAAAPVAVLSRALDRTPADLRNFSVGYGNEPIIDDLVGENDPAPHDAINRGHPNLLQTYLPNYLSELFAWRRKGVVLATRTRRER